ncbi:MAG TPA: hypothetical protein VHI72_05895 [Hyphomicrobiaceae bacterium]|jgi:hypothetical protein|nr:hypothetical protein [Hyphomicrobiaceae bacterium]
MPQASYCLSPSGADDNDLGQEHFDATLLACGEAVASLINSSPRTPTAEQIRDTIQGVLRQGFEPVYNSMSDEDDGRLGASQNPDDPLDFKGVPEAAFRDTNDEFASAYLPSVRLACCFLQKDRAAVMDAARAMTADGKDDLLDTLLRNWGATKRRFRLIIDGIESAEARIEIALRAIEEQGR